MASACDSLDREEVIMAGRRIRDIADARACLAAVARSGVERVQWCRANGVDGRSLQARYLNLGGRRPRHAQASGLRLVELVAERPTLVSRYLIRVGPMCIEVESAFDEASLRRLLAVVSSC